MTIPTFEYVYSLRRQVPELNKVIFFMIENNLHHLQVNGYEEIVVRNFRVAYHVTDYPDFASLIDTQTFSDSILKSFEAEAFESNEDMEIDDEFRGFYHYSHGNGNSTEIPFIISKTARQSHPYNISMSFLDTSFKGNPRYQREDNEETS